MIHILFFLSVSRFDINLFILSGKIPNKVISLLIRIATKLVIDARPRISKKDSKTIPMNNKINNFN